MKIPLEILEVDNVDDCDGKDDPPEVLEDDVDDCDGKDGDELDKEE